MWPVRPAPRPGLLGAAERRWPLAKWRREGWKGRGRGPKGGGAHPEPVCVVDAARGWPVSTDSDDGARQGAAVSGTRASVPGLPGPIPWAGRKRSLRRTSPCSSIRVEGPGMTASSSTRWRRWRSSGEEGGRGEGAASGGMG